MSTIDYPQKIVRNSGTMETLEPYEQLESLWGTINRLPHMVACSSGTTALHLALEALELPLGSKVIVPEFTMVACARAVTLAGHIPIFVDCYFYDLLIDIERLQATLRAHIKNNDPIRAVMPVHVYGRYCNMKAILALAKEYEFYIVEDLSEAHGILPTPDTDAACWSFYSNKIIAGEEGGAVGFKEPLNSALARSLRCLGFTPEHNFAHYPRGINGRLSNANASLILNCLDQGLDNILARRRLICSWYDNYIPASLRMPDRAVCWVYDIRLPEFIDIDLVVSTLLSKGIQVRHGFKPMSSQMEYYQEGSYNRKSYAASSRVIYFPLDLSITEEQVRKQCDSLLSCLYSLG